MRPLSLDSDQKRALLTAVEQLVEAERWHQRVVDWGSNDSSVSDEDAAEAAEEKALQAFQHLRTLIDGTEVMYFHYKHMVMVGTRVQLLDGSQAVVFEDEGALHVVRPDVVYDTEYLAELALRDQEARDGTD